jgi:ubiquinone/menaquinone biosynthesis C-methylase UbiE
MEPILKEGGALESAETNDEYRVVAEFYDYVVLYRERQDVVFYVEMARESGGPVLELGCGTGRVLIPIARAGIEINGVDNSSSMLAICKQKLTRESAGVQSRVVLMQADMRNFELGRQFPLVTTPFRSFQHLLTTEDQMSCLRSAHRHLLPQGRFVLDVFNPDLDRLTNDKYLTEPEMEPEFTMPDGRHVIRRARVLSRDTFSQIQEIELVHHVTHADGRVEELTHRFPMRYLFRYEGEHLLARSGFKVENVYADYDKSPFGSKYPGELIFIARKQ